MEEGEDKFVPHLKLKTETLEPCRRMMVVPVKWVVRPSWRVINYPHERDKLLLLCHTRRFPRVK